MYVFRIIFGCARSSLVAVVFDGKEQGAVVDPHERFPWTDLERAHLRYAKGIVLDRLGEIAPALIEFQAAAALAGPGEIRTRGLYNRGTIQLLATEAKRDGFIEESKAQAGGGAPVPPPPPLPGAPDEEPENPIEVLREGYGKARDFLLEHMKLDSSHVDTRANLELIVRRMRELDFIEEQQEDQEQDQEQEEQDGEESEDSEEESGEASEPEEDSPSDEDSQSSEESEEPEDEEEYESEEFDDDDNSDVPPCAYCASGCSRCLPHAYTPPSPEHPPSPPPPQRAIAAAPDVSAHRPPQRTIADRGRARSRTRAAAR